MVYGSVLLELRSCSAPGRHTRAPAPRAQRPGLRQSEEYGKLWEESRLERDWYVLLGVSGHHLFQREVLESQWYLPKPLKAESFFIVIIKITCPMSSGNTKALVSSLFLPCDGISG